MKGLMKFLAVAVWLCATLLCVALGVRADETVKIPCIAQYFPLTPSEGVGNDGCGHTWKLLLPMSDIDRANAKKAGVDKSMATAQGDSVECYFWNLESGAYYRIPCPAPGDTLGVVEVPVN